MHFYYFHFGDFSNLFLGIFPKFFLWPVRRAAQFHSPSSSTSNRVEFLSMLRCEKAAAWLDKWHWK